MSKQKSVVSSLSDKLRRDISLGVVKPGEKLNIEGLKRDYSVSHPSVREALSLLVGEGYVSFEESKGFWVMLPSRDTLQDIIRLRAELEAKAFEWAVQRTNLDWRSQVIAAHYALSEVERQMPSDPLNAALDWDERNRQFHMTITKNCGSPKLIELVETQYDQSRRYRMMAHAEGLSEKSRMLWVEKSAAEHNALKDAVLAGDLEAGPRILRKHITKTTLHSIEDVGLYFEGRESAS
ncbi:MAG: FCD domain-containing protein [Pseudomonadota bacterium]